MRISTKGLILKEQNIGEQDRLITVLTEKIGLVRAFVKNGRSLRSTTAAATRLFCFSRLIIYEGREKYIIDEAVSEEMFIKLRNDVEALTLAQYFCELMIYLAPENMPAKYQLQLMLNSLYMLAQGKRSKALIKGTFEMRLMELSGYMADLVCCKKCRCYQTDTMYFLPKSGTLLCEDCFDDSEEAIKIGTGVLTALRHSIYAEPKKLFSFNLSDESLRLYELCCEQYVLSTLEHGFKTLNFYKTIRTEI